MTSPWPPVQRSRSHRPVRDFPLGLLLMVALLGMGCRGDVVEGPALFTVRDSAGVRIVENGWTPDGAWRVSPEPLFTVGWEEDGPQFTWLQSGLVLPDGGALVADYGAGAVFRLGADGSVLETWGRKGEGPGEYQRLDAVLLKGDSVVVSDGGLRRLTVRSPDGSVRTTTLPTGLILPVVTSILPDERVLVLQGEGYGAGDRISPEWVFQTQPIEVASLRAGTVDTIVELPHLRRWYGTPGASPGPIHVKGRAGGFRDGFAWARSDRSAVRWYSAQGDLLQIATWEEEAAALTPAWRDEMRGIYEEWYGDRPPEFVSAQLARLEEELDLHDGPLPYWDQLHVDAGGNVWLSRYPLPAQSPDRWRVVTGEGEFVGWVDLPGVRSILDITDDRILAVSLNEFDVAAVRMLKLVKP